MVLPLQLPGGPELLVVGLLFLISLAIAVGLIGVFVFSVRGGSSGSVSEQQRIDELEQRVTALEEKLDRTDDSADSDDSLSE